MTASLAAEPWKDTTAQPSDDRSSPRTHQGICEAIPKPKEMLVRMRRLDPARPSVHGSQGGYCLQQRALAAAGRRQRRMLPALLSFSALASPHEPSACPCRCNGWRSSDCGTATSCGSARRSACDAHYMPATSCFRRHPRSKGSRCERLSTDRGLGQQGGRGSRGKRGAAASRRPGLQHGIIRGVLRLPAPQVGHPQGHEACFVSICTGSDSNCVH